MSRRRHRRRWPWLAPSPWSRGRDVETRSRRRDRNRHRRGRRFGAQFIGSVRQHVIARARGDRCLRWRSPPSRPTGLPNPARTTPAPVTVTATPVAAFVDVAVRLPRFTTSVRSVAAVNRGRVRRRRRRRNGGADANPAERHRHRDRGRRGGRSDPRVVGDGVFSRAAIDASRGGVGCRAAVDRSANAGAANRDGDVDADGVRGGVDRSRCGVLDHVVAGSAINARRPRDRRRLRQRARDTGHRHGARERVVVGPRPGRHYARVDDRIGARARSDAFAHRFSARPAIPNRRSGKRHAAGTEPDPCRHAERVRCHDQTAGIGD